MNVENVLNGSAKLGFRYTIEHIRDGRILSVDEATNLIPTEGLNHIVSVIMKAVSPVSVWYCGLYEGNYTPSAGVTAATVVAAATESTAYTSATRLAFSGGAVSGGAVDNTASKFEFTINASKTIYGAFLMSNSSKGNGTGTLLSVVRFPEPKILVNTDIFRVTAGLIIISV